jgi:hypothetical protein
VEECEYAFEYEKIMEIMLCYTSSDGSKRRNKKLKIQVRG